MRKIYILLFLLTLSFSVFAGGEDTKLFYLFPVPLKGSTLSVKLNGPNGSIAAVELRNLVGKKLNEKSFPKSSDELIFDEMDSYPNGIYVVIAKDAYGKIVEIAKFIINR